MPNSHAVLSPSSSHRWLHCTPSVMLEEDLSNISSQAAEEGTAAHALCEHKLKKALRIRSKRPVSVYDNDEMEEYTDAYVAFVMEQFAITRQTCRDPLILIEQKVNLAEYVPNCFGTADCLIISDNCLHVIDFKFGYTRVEAENNSQLKIYLIPQLM